ncbi:zinc-dependent metalloprotease, partial [Acinetobacter baumannii]
THILEENSANGLLFIADADARAAGGFHPNAPLWDNGTDAVSELKNVLAVRNKALSTFSVNNVQNNVPISKLEDALVPIYNYHRY